MEAMKTTRDMYQGTNLGLYSEGKQIQPADFFTGTVVCISSAGNEIKQHNINSILVQAVWTGVIYIEIGEQ